TALAQEVLRSMLFHRLRLAAMTILFLGAVAAGVVGRGSPDPVQPPDRRAPAREAARPEPSPPDATRPAPGRTFVVGRVLDPDGRPVPNATVSVASRRKLLFAGMNSEGIYPSPIGHAASDASGQFRLDAPRTSSAHHSQPVTTAIAPGFGLGW